MTETAERIVLASRPVGEPTLDNFRLQELPIPQPGPGQMLLRTLWLSLDPYMRGRMSDAPSYAKPVGIGGVMEGGTVSEVIASNVPRFAKGDIVVGRAGWQTHALSDGSSLQKVDPTRAPIQTALGVLGMPGMTAYMGLLEIGKPAAGETVVVAAASGAVGSVVGQIARIKGARAVGIAGGPDKCRYVTEELGFEFLHRPPGTRSRCPSGHGLPERHRRLFRECRRCSGKTVPDEHYHEHVTVYHVKDRGLVVLSSCSHRGVVNAVKQAQEVSGVDKLHALLGGFHLGPAPMDYTKHIASEIVDLKPDIVVPMHCSGENFVEAMREIAPDRLFLGSTGATLTFGA